MDTFIAQHRDALVEAASNAFADVLANAETLERPISLDIVDTFAQNLDAAMSALVNYAAELKAELDELNAKGDKGRLDRSGERRRTAVGKIRGQICRGERDYHPLSWLAQRGFLPATRSRERP